MKQINLDHLRYLYQQIAGLKTLLRQGWRRFDIDNIESVADHSFGVALMGLYLAPHFPKTNAKDVVIGALVHDLPEVLCGDFTPHDGYTKEQTKEMELKAAQELFQKMGDDGTWQKAWEDVFYIRTPSAELVKICDRLELFFQAHDYQDKYGEDLQEFFEYCYDQIKDPDIIDLMNKMQKTSLQTK